MQGFSVRRIVTGVIAILVLISLAFVTSGDRARVSGIEGIIRDGFAPVGGGLSWVMQGIGGWGRSLAQLGNAFHENGRLRQEVVRLTAENNRLLEAHLENERLRRLLELRDEVNYETVACRVIGRDPGNFFSTLIVDKGSLDGLATNMVAVTEHGVVGRVSSVTRRSAVVHLITDPGSAVGGIVQRSRSVVLVEGSTNDCILKGLTPDLDVKPGDRIITSGYGGVFPKGLVIGEVVRLVRGSYGIAPKAVVRPAADLSRLEEVLILKKERVTE